VQEKEEEITGMLDRECSMLLSREADLDTREAALEVDQIEVSMSHFDCVDLLWVSLDSPV
jgi:hypothetical protein